MNEERAEVLRRSVVVGLRSDATTWSNQAADAIEALAAEVAQLKAENGNQRGVIERYQRENENLLKDYNGLHWIVNHPEDQPPFRALLVRAEAAEENYRRLKEAAQETWTLWLPYLDGLKVLNSFGADALVRLAALSEAPATEGSPDFTTIHQADLVGLRAAFFAAAWSRRPAEAPAQEEEDR